MSGRQTIRLLLADVDGTLVTQDKVLTDEAKSAAEDLHRAGIILAITSGRPPRGMSMLIDALVLQSATAGFNGGAFVNPDLSVIESHLLDPLAAEQAVRLILDHGLDAWVYSPEEWMVRDKTAPHVEHEAWTVKFDPKVVRTFTDENLANVAKIVGVSDDGDQMTACENAARRTLDKKASVSSSQPYYLDVTHPQANKGTVVSFLSR